MLFQAASTTLLTLGRDPDRLGAQIGFTAVLHTWTRALLFHLHLHCIVTSGGLSGDGERWIRGSSEYLFPVEIISKLYRGKFVAALTSAYRTEQLDLPNNLATPEEFEILRRDLFSKSWNVYSKRPFAGPEQVYSYLGRYTHRVGISNHRILSVTGDSVTIATRGNGTAIMHPHEFIRRFLSHVLPKGFVKIRHYGLLASANVSSKLVVAQNLLQTSKQSSDSAGLVEPQGWAALTKALTVEPRVCPVCGSDRLFRVPLPPKPLEADCPRAPP
jgi:hypothetical protein